jgi:hypothetical protein
MPVTEISTNAFRVTAACDVAIRRLSLGDIAAVSYEDDRRRGEPEDVQAASDEEAVARIAASRPLTEAGVVYEVWPEQEPGCILRVTLEPPRLRPPIA